jgi:hypothetical protein
MKESVMEAAPFGCLLPMMLGAMLLIAAVISTALFLVG